tara:strand:- start:1148 stop:1729 length:582 start_codon:yes stop_codon:yes gene_type:complete
MSTLELNGKDFATQTSSAEPVLASTVTGGAGLMPTGVTSLGTVTVGNLSNTAIVYPSQYSFSARLSGDQSVSTSEWTKATINVSIFGGWDTTNYKFVCPRAGKWQFNFSARFNDGAYGRFVKLYKNGSPWDQGGSVSFGVTSYNPTVRHAVLVELALDDDIELYVYGTSGITTLKHDDDDIIQTAIQGFLLLG